MQQHAEDEDLVTPGLRSVANQRSGYEAYTPAGDPPKYQDVKKAALMSRTPQARPPQRIGFILFRIGRFLWLSRGV